jgi:hypothetical protein
LEFTGMSLSVVKSRRKHTSLRASRRNGTSNGRALRKSRSLPVHANGRNGARKVKRSRPTRAAKPRRPALRTQAHKVSARLGRPLKNGAPSKLACLVSGTANSNGHSKDRIMLMARDSFWLHAYWQISLSSVQRAEAALREDWHGAKPILRVFDVSSEDTTSSSERHVRDIDLHGSVNNWYIDVANPSRSYRVDIGYLSRRGRFYALAHSNVVTAPAIGANEAIDEHWASVQEQFERIYAMSGRPDQAPGGSDSTRPLEDRLRRPLDSAPWANFVLGSLTTGRKRRFWFDLDAELIVHGSTQPSSRVTLQGERVSLRPDGTFTMRFRLPDKRLIIPATAASPEGCEERTIVLAVERNTKELEPMVHETREE